MLMFPTEQRSNTWSESSSLSILCVYEQRRLCDYAGVLSIFFFAAQQWDNIQSLMYQNMPLHNFVGAVVVK